MFLFGAHNYLEDANNGTVVLNFIDNNRTFHVLFCSFLGLNKYFRKDFLYKGNDADFKSAS